MELRQLPIQSKKIARLAYRPNNVDLLSPFARARNRILTGVRRGGRPTDRHNLVITMIERRTNEVVHPSIDNRKLLRARFFNETHSCEHHTGVASKKATGLHKIAKL